MRHELSERDRLLPDSWDVSGAMNDLAGTKTEEVGMEVFTHGETMLLQLNAVKPTPWPLTLPAAR